MNVEQILAGAKDGFLLEPESKGILAQSGISTTACRVANTADEAVKLAEEIGYPVVLKALSPQIVHKSDVGGVHLDLNDASAVRQAYQRIKGATRVIDPEARATVQPMAAKGVEVIAGLTTNPQFGKVLMFGLGGIFTELLKDVSFRLVPIEELDAREMIGSIEGNGVLEGFRGGPAADVDAIVDILLKVSTLAESYPAIAELDLNPIIVYPRGAVVVDARIGVSRGRVETRSAPVRLPK
ncbi:MAG: acetate--CoA ligase family protein [Chloroflexi bacterium]|nr:acetate--CoA ligase family protein [Chloroflexota bacterium]MDA8188751.1 acetate--CoA ligase family protein [Dehalococcoidales bacterium]